jgi:hypothetical protein
VNGLAFDPSSRNSTDKNWSRRDFVKLSFAAGSAIVAASLVGVGTEPKNYRVAALGTDPCTGTVLDSIRRIQSTEIVSLSERHTKPDLIVIGAADLSDARLAALAANSKSSVLIVSHVCQPIAALAELAPARLRKGRLVHAGGRKGLVPELIPLAEMIQDRLCESDYRPVLAETTSVRHKMRVFSGWAIWIDPLA